MAGQQRSAQDSRIGGADVLDAGAARRPDVRRAAAIARRAGRPRARDVRGIRPVRAEDDRPMRSDEASVITRYVRIWTAVDPGRRRRNARGRLTGDVEPAGHGRLGWTSWDAIGPTRVSRAQGAPSRTGGRRPTRPTRSRTRRSGAPRSSATSTRGSGSATSSGPQRRGSSAHRVRARPRGPAPSTARRADGGRVRRPDRLHDADRATRRRGGRRSQQPGWPSSPTPARGRSAVGS